MARSNTSMNIILGVVNTGLYKGLNAASARVAKFAGKMKAVGSQLTSSFTMPFALIGGASVKMAMDFEKAMTKVQTLVLGSAQDMDTYASAVKNIASATAISATETADGLFFLASAGLRGVNALETLTEVNKGVAIGLGEAGDLAVVAAAAQNAYGKDTITATQAIEKFGMAVRTGMFESKELAESLGTQVGLAAELGISFDELLANISTYTKTTGDARSATTGFGGVMMAITKPTAQGEKALDDINMSYKSLKEMVADSGLAATLFHLKDAFASQGIEMTKLFGKSQAVKNVMGVLGEQGETYKQILDEMSDSAGFTSDAFDVLSQTPSFKIEQSINNIKLAFQEIGAIIMPTISKIIQGIANLIGWFGNLDQSTKNWALAIAGILALAGPLISFVGFLAGAVSFLISPIGLIIAGLTLLGVAIYKNWNIVKKWVAAIANYFIKLYNESMFFRGALQYVIMVFKNLWEQGKFAFKTLWNIIKLVGNNIVTYLKGVGKMIMGVFTLSWEDVKEGFNDVTSGMKDNFDDALDDIGKDVKESGKVIADNLNTAINNTLRSEKVEFIDEDDIQGGVDAMLGMGEKGFEKLKSFFEGGGTKLDFSNMFSDLGGGDGGGGGGGGGGDGDGDGDGDGGGGNLEKQKSALRKHLEGMSESWRKYFAEQDAAWESWGQVAQEATLVTTEKMTEILGQFDALGQQRHENKMQQLQNEQNAEINSLQQLGLSEEEFNKRKDEINEKYAKKKKTLEIKEARREKSIAIFQALINTAAGIAKAIPNAALMAFAGIMGAAQVAAISSAPIPMATGALAFSPVNAIVGDNPNALNDPEVIAPLSKLEKMIGRNGSTVRVVGELSGEDIVLSSEKAKIGMSRYI